MHSFVLVFRDHIKYTSLGLRSTESNENRQHQIFDLKYLVSVIFNGKLSKNYIDYIFGQLGLGIKIATATILTVNRLISVLPCLALVIGGCQQSGDQEAACNNRGGKQRCFKNLTLGNLDYFFGLKFVTSTQKVQLVLSNNLFSYPTDHYYCTNNEIIDKIN